MPFVCGCRLGLGVLYAVYAKIQFVIVLFSSLPQYSVPLSLRMRITPISCERKKGKTRSLSRSVPVMGVLVV